MTSIKRAFWSKYPVKDARASVEYEILFRTANTLFHNVLLDHYSCLFGLVLQHIRRVANKWVCVLFPQF